MVLCFRANCLRDMTSSFEDSTNIVFCKNKKRKMEISLSLLIHTGILSHSNSEISLENFKFDNSYGMCLSLNGV